MSINKAHKIADYCYSWVFVGKFVIIICDSGRAYDLALRALKHAKLDCANLTINPFVYSENHIAASDYSIKSVYNLKNQSTQKNPGLSTEILLPRYRTAWNAVQCQAMEHIMQEKGKYLDSRHPRSKAHEECETSIHTSAAEAAAALNSEDNLCEVSKTGVTLLTPMAWDILTPFHAEILKTGRSQT